MFEIRVKLRNLSVGVGYANDLTSALQQVLSLNLDASMMVFKEIPMTAMRQGRENLGCFARKQAMKGDK